MVHRHVAGPLNKDRSASRHGRRDGCKQGTGRPVHREERLLRAVHFRGGVHLIPQDAFRVVQVVKAVDFRDVQLCGAAPERVHDPLVPRHVEGVCVGLRVRPQLVFQILSHKHLILGSDPGRGLTPPEVVPLIQNKESQSDSLRAGARKR